MRLTPQQLEALVRLRGNADFAINQTIVKDYQDDLTAKLKQAVEPHQLYRAQGGIAALQGLLDMFAEAPETIKKLTGK